MARKVEEAYFAWLCDHINVNYGKFTRKTYSGLFRHLHGKEFVWIVPNDDNRLEDALDIRYAFLDETGIRDSGNLLMGIPPFSILEVMVALSRRLHFMDDWLPVNWSWKLIENLGLDLMHDPLTTRQDERIEEILETLIWRNYEPDGNGGFFPLEFPNENQTKVEIWYQMAAYLGEKQNH